MRANRNKAVILTALAGLLFCVYQYFYTLQKIEFTKKDDKSFFERMEKRMKDRRELVKQKCLELGIVKQRQRKVKFMVSDEYKIAYCCVPKSGCTNFKRIMLMLIENRTYEDVIKIKQQSVHKEALKYMQDITDQDSIRSYLRVMVVREPHTRFVSAFKDKIAVQKSGKHPQYFATSDKIRVQYGNKRRRNLTNAEANFVEFVKYVVDGNSEIDETIEKHWATYESICDPCYYHYHVIAHTETLEEDTRYVAELINAPKHVQISGGYSNGSSTNILKSSIKQFDLVGEDFQKAWTDAYSVDFKMFGYPSYP